MAKLFPFRPDSDHDTDGPRLVNLDDDGAADVFSALSADTARVILSRIYDSPATASDVADAADTSLQNARYHLEKLEAAGLIEDVDTWYSSRGTEMTVYGPTNDPLVVAAGDDESESVLKRALERVVGSVAVLAVASVFVDQLIRRVGSVGFSARDPGTYDGDPNVAAGGTATPTPAPTGGPSGTDAELADAQAGSETATDGTPVEEMARTSLESEPSVSPTVADTATPDPTLVTDGGRELLGSLPPGAVFFAGGLVVLAGVCAWWYLRRYRPMYA